MEANPGSVSLFKLVSKYARPLWKRIALLVVLTLLANMLISLQPVIFSGFVEIILHTSKTSPSPDNQTMSPDRKGKLFDLNYLGSYVKKFIANFSGGKEDIFSSLKTMTIIFIIIIFVAAVFYYLAEITSRWIKAQSARLIRMDILKHLLTLNLGFFHRQKSGELVSRITVDVTNTANGLGPLIRGFIHHTALIVIYSIYLFSTSLWLTLGALVMIFMQFGLTRLIKNPIRKNTRKYLDKIAGLSTTLQEMLLSIRVIKSFGAENFEMKKLDKDVDKVSRADFKLGLISEMEPPARGVLDSFAILGIVLIATMQFIRGSLSPQGFLLFIFVGRLIIEPINKFNVNIAWTQALLASYERLGELFSEKPRVIEGRVAKIDFQEKITIDNASFSYENDFVLNNISLEVKKGEVVALVGPSGAGKSTLVDLILRFYDPQKGRIGIDGINLTALSTSTYRTLFGVVPQETLLFNDTIANNISYGRETLSKRQIVEAATIANAYEFISGFPQGFDTIVGDRGTRLSGGERQRIAIARAIVSKPQIIIFDEATSSLDTDSEKQVQVAIERVLKNCTAVIIAHRLSTILHADKIVVLNKGKVESIGRHAELLEKSETYRRLYELQFNAGERII